MYIYINIITYIYIHIVIQYTCFLQNTGFPKNLINYDYDGSRKGLRYVQ